MATMGNVTAALAALIYLFPLQYLLHERKTKRDDIGTFVAALVILLPMWGLLLVCLLAAVTAGALDVLALTHVRAGILAAAGLVAMAVVSFMRLERVPHGNGVVSALLAASMHVFPLLTLALSLAYLNPGILGPGPLGPGLLAHPPMEVVRFAWLGFAGVCLAVCVPFSLMLLTRALWRRASEFGYRLLGGRGRSAAYLQEVASLDPTQDFTRLVGMTNAYYGGAVRNAAAARLRTTPDMTGRLVRELAAGSAESALFALTRIKLTHEEQASLAGPASAAIHRLAAEVRADARPMSMFHRIGMRLAASRMIRGVAQRFPDATNEFAQAHADLLQALTQPTKPIR